MVKESSIKLLKIAYKYCNFFKIIFLKLVFYVCSGSKLPSHEHIIFYLYLKRVFNIFNWIKVRSSLKCLIHSIYN